jgi:hypothetical protein
MANVKFTDLPNLASITANTIIPVVDANVNYSVTTANLQSFVNNSAGNITGNYFIGNGSQLTGIVSSYGNSNVSAFLPTYNGNIGANVITATGNVAGLYFIGDGSLLTGISSYGNSNVAAYLPTFTGNLNPNTVSASGNITAPFFFGNGSQLTGLPATYGNSNVVSLMSSFGSNIIVTSGNITAGYFTGNGAGLTNLPAGILAGNQTGNIAGNGFSMLNIASITSAGTISAAGNITGANINGNFTGSGANLSNIVTSIAAGSGISVNSSTGAVTITNNNPTPYANANVSAFLPTYSGVLAGASLTATGNITANNAAITNNIRMSGGTPRINLGSNGAAAPTVNAYSSGVKLVLYENLTAQTSGYTLGVEGNNMWFGTDSPPNESNPSGWGFKWYAGATQMANLSGYGNLTANGNISGNNVTVTGANARVSLLGPSSNKVYFNTLGVGPPTVGALSPGAKVVLFDSTTTDPAYGAYAIGIDGFTLWFSTDTDMSNFEYYQGNAKIASIESYGIVANNVVYTGTAGTAGQVLTTYANGVTYFANTSSTFSSNVQVNASLSVTGAVTVNDSLTTTNFVSSNQIRTGVGTPTSTSAGVAGTMVYNSSYLYVCVTTNTWKRIALSSF